MMTSWWYIWVAFMLVFLAMPTGYGWGYRGWGPPYPRYYQRRRAAMASNIKGYPDFDHHAWGWGGDLVWVAFAFGMMWVLMAIWWR